jgi:hypothetical protein
MTKEELLSRARQAIAEGDIDTANQLMDAAEQMQPAKAEAPQQEPQGMQEAPQNPQERAALEKVLRRNQADAALADRQLKVLETAGGAANIVGGAVGGAADLVTAIPDYVTSKVTGEPNRHKERVSDIKGSLSDLGYNTEGMPYMAGDIAAKVAGTLPIGGAIAAPLKNINALKPLASAVATGGMNAGTATGLGGALTRAGGGAINAAATSAVIDPTLENIGTDTAIGAAVPTVLAPLAGAVKAIGRSAQGQVSDVERFAAKNDFPIYTSDVFEPKTWYQKAAQSVSEKIPLIGTADGRAAQQEVKKGITQKIASTYGEPSSEEVAASLVRKSEALKKSAGKGYDKIIGAMGTEPVPLTQTIKTIDDSIAKLTAPGSIGDDTTVKSLQAIKDKLTSGVNDLTLARENRTGLREQFMNDAGVINDTGERVLQKVYKSLTDDMHAAVSTKLSPIESKKMRAIDTVWRRESDELRQTRLKKVLKDPLVAGDSAARMLFSAKKQELGILYKNLDEKGRQAARALIIETAKDNPEKFAREMSGKYANHVNTFFKGEDKKFLEGAVKYIQATKRSSEAAVMTQNGQQLLLPGAIASIWKEPTIGIPMAGLVLGTRIYETPVVRKLLSRAASVPVNSTQFEQIVNRVSEIAAKSAPIANKEAQQ